MGRLGGRKGAKEGAGIQWPMFPSLCRVLVGEEMVDKEEEEEVVEVVDKEEEEEEVVEVVEVVDKEEEVVFEGEENSRACSVAGLGLGLGWMGRLSFTFFLESEFFVF